jgi:translation elongation factor aEF-1 beta
MEKCKMAKIVVSYKIFPSDINVDFEKLKQSIEKSLPPQVEVYGYSIEPIAFGLNALIAHIILPEDKSGILENLEENLKNIPEISQIQTIMVRRTH